MILDIRLNPSQKSSLEYLLTKLFEDHYEHVCSGLEVTFVTRYDHDGANDYRVHYTHEHPCGGPDVSGTVYVKFGLREASIEDLEWADGSR